MRGCATPEEPKDGPGVAMGLHGVSRTPRVEAVNGK